MTHRVVTSRPVNPSAWLVLQKKMRQAIITHSRMEAQAAMDRTTKMMELERIANSIYDSTPGFRKHVHTEGGAQLYKGKSLLSRAGSPPNLS